MKILIYGAGVTSVTYGWQLSKAGHHITVMVRKGQKPHIYEKGIHLTCKDFRKGKKVLQILKINHAITICSVVETIKKGLIR